METLQSLRDEIKSVKKQNSKEGMDQISASDLKPGPSKQPTSSNTQPNNNQLNTRTSDYPWRQSFVGLLYNHSSVRGFSPSSDQIRTTNHLSMFLWFNQRNTWIRENIRFRPNILFHLLPQGNLRPLCKSKSLLSPKGFLLNKTNNKQTQILFLEGSRHV